MIFPRKKNVQAPTGPWWQSPKQPKSSKGTLILIALLAGSVGGFLGVNASGGSLNNKVDFVSSTSTIERAPDSVAGIAQRVLPSVVSIDTRTLNGGGSGSGFIFDGNGYILTNNHVISEAAQNGGKIRVSLNDGTTYTAKVIGRDASFDLAVLKIEGKGFKAIPIGNSDDLKIGQWVLAVGNPFNLTSTVTAGIVSAKARNINLLSERSGKDVFPIESFIQTDAAVNPGNSGGALVNTNGELVGINTAIASQTGSYSGYSFAIPVNLVQKVMSDIIDYGIVQRGFLGVQISDITQEIKEKEEKAQGQEEQARGARVRAAQVWGAPRAARDRLHGRAVPRLHAPDAVRV